MELKAEKQRAEQREGIKPSKPDQKATRSLDEEDAAPGVAGWLSRNKPLAAVALLALVAVCVQSLGVADVKQAAAHLLSPITTVMWKVCLLPFLAMLLDHLSGVAHMHSKTFGLRGFAS